MDTTIYAHRHKNFRNIPSADFELKKKVMVIYKYLNNAPPVFTTKK